MAKSTPKTPDPTTPAPEGDEAPHGFGGSYVIGEDGIRRRAAEKAPEAPDNPA